MVVDTHPTDQYDGQTLLDYWTRSWNDLYTLTVEDDIYKADVEFPADAPYVPANPDAEARALLTIAMDIGFTETRRVINFYLRTAEEPSMPDFMDTWPEYQHLAHVTKHDRMYRHPDPRDYSEEV